MYVGFMSVLSQVTLNFLIALESSSTDRVHLKARQCDAAWNVPFAFNMNE